MIIFYNKKNKRFIGTLDAPVNNAGIKIIPNGVEPQDIIETNINPKLLEKITEIKKISPANVIIKLDKNNKVIGFDQEKNDATYSRLKQQHQERHQRIKENLIRFKNKKLSTKSRLDALAELIELKIPFLENI